MNTAILFDYNEIKENCDFRLIDQRTVDISVIIPVFGRLQFHNIVIKSIKNAIEHIQNKNFSKSVSITIIEHSDDAEHLELCSQKTNYIWLPKYGGVFNKSLAQNVGAIFSNRATHYLFHDIDTVVPKDFFEKLFLNINWKACNYDALQCFTNRRLLYANQYITDRILRGVENVDNLHSKHENVTIGGSGAKGGSMLIDASLFFRCGAYFENYTEYGVEDADLYDRLNIMGKLGGADAPPIELIHLWHKPSYNRITKASDFNFFELFSNMKNIDKLKYMDMRCKHLIKFLE